MNLNGVVSMWKMRELVDKATNLVMNYTETEAKVRILQFCFVGYLGCDQSDFSGPRGDQ